MVYRHISDELKEMALSMSLQGLSDHDIRDFTGISERSLKRVRSTFRDTGQVSRVPLATGRNRMLTPMEAKFLCHCVERQPDMALKELQTELEEVFNVEASVQTVARTLERAGYTMKSVTRPARERNAQDRAEFQALIRTHFRPEQLVFADESHFNRLTLRRPYAWSIRGQRATRSEFFFRGTKYSILPAISLDGILHLEVLENAITGDDFRRFVEGLLPRMNQWPLPHSVLVVDNASIHKVAGIQQLVEERGARLLYLPAYSPDFNPIELAFSTIKSWLRMNRDRVNEEYEAEDGIVYNILWEAVHAVTSEHAKGWYKHCGYILDE